MNPVNVDKLLTEILSHLFGAELRRLDRWVDDLISSNQEAYNDYSLQGFVHNGVVYKPSTLQMATNQIKRRGLHSSLSEEMRLYEKDLQVLMDDKAFIRQSLFRLLDPCIDRQEIRDALPDCLSNCLAWIQGLSRQKEEAFTIKDDERAMRQYQQVRPKIELYTVARMLY